jgi:hypothetical protein
VPLRAVDKAPLRLFIRRRSGLLTNPAQAFYKTPLRLFIKLRSGLLIRPRSGFLLEAAEAFMLSR